MTENIRGETEIFDELADICSSPGYAHAIAYLCFRDNTITRDDVFQQFSMDRLVRTEISTLIGLAGKEKLDTNLPSPDAIQRYIDNTDALLMELGGWKSYEMVLRYAHLAPKHLANAASRIEKPLETVANHSTISLR